ncbi:MAG: HAD-IIIA family hydrolase, partial [Lentisphaeria bacterium]|nr:HAD-IIIA family hydrolase [Lentisphaeria bacterium]
PRFVTIPQVIVLPGVAASLRSIREHGFLAVVVTNQGYVGRGVVTREELDAVHEHLNAELAKAGAHIDRFYVCPHPAGTQCDCRKPKPGLFLRAAEELGIDLGRSIMVGDRLGDIAAGRAAGCRESFLVRNGGWGERTLAGLDAPPDFPVRADLAEVVRSVFHDWY